MNDTKKSGKSRKLKSDKDLVAYYENIVKMSYDGIFVVDSDGNFEFGNDAFYKIIDWPESELIGQPFIKVIPEDKHSFMLERWKEVQQGIAGQYESEIITGKGVRKPLQVSHNRMILTDTDDVKYCVIIRDLTEAKKAEKSYYDIIQTSLDGFWICDKQGRIIEANRAFCDMLGYTKEEVLAMSIPDFEIEESPEETAAHLRLLMERGWDVFETKHKRKDGSIVEVEISSRLTDREGGKIVVFTKDITQRKRTEKELEALVTERTFELENKIAEALEKEKVIEMQAREILELSIPVIRVWEGVLAAPLIGSFDSSRAGIFAEQFLNAIAEAGAIVAIIDITGVPAIDTQTAQNLLDTIGAARLLGTRIIITGIRPEIAVTIVHLGIDLKGTVTCSSLEEGLQKAFEICNYKIISEAL